MNPIPWYKSNTLRGLLVAVLAQLVAIFHVSDAVTSDAIAANVDKFLDIISLIATAYAAYARSRQPTPPLTQAAADKTAARVASETPTSTQQGGFAQVSVLSAMSVFTALALTCMTFVVGCATPPTAVVASACGTGNAVSQFGIERCAKGTVDVYNVYQKRGLELLQDPSTPESVKQTIKQIDAHASPIAHDILVTAAVFVNAKAAGAHPGDPAWTGPEVHLMNLQAQLQHDVRDMQATLAGGVK